MEYKARYEQWIQSSLVEESLIKELLSIKEKDSEIAERFCQHLEFGTAGLRGILGAGTNRMNVMVVRRAAKGLGEYLIKHASSSPIKVAIAYDSRHYSERFAKETASVFASIGIVSCLFDTLHPVPMLSFAVLHHQCAAGVVITASHNPPEYNGFKVYGENGGQIDPECANKIMEEIKSIDELVGSGMPFAEAVKGGLIKLIGDETDEQYYQDTLGLLQNPELVQQHGGKIGIVYTPLHGSGQIPVTTLLNRAGFTKVHVVEEQKRPDGCFPTVKAPNPEDEMVFDLAVDLADRTSSDLCLATDPDADRVGVAVRNQSGGFTFLNGNQIGCLLLNYILSCKTKANALKGNAIAARSFVSTRLADHICREFGVCIKEVPTGFRFISSIISECENNGEQFLFGFEESYGYLAGSVSRDKDAVSTAMLLCEAALYYSFQGKSLLNVLEEIWETFGFFMETTCSIALQGIKGMEKIVSAMQRLKDLKPRKIGGQDVVGIKDYTSKRYIDLASGESSPLPFGTNAIIFELMGDGFVCIRPSGTEPKLKYYVAVKDVSKKRAEEKLFHVKNDIGSIIKMLLEN